MTYTYDQNTNGCLIIHATESERAILANRAEHPDIGLSKDGMLCRIEDDIIKSLTDNSDLDTIAPEEIAALTSAPILGFRDAEGVPTHAWAYMDYQVRSFASDLIETGKAVFIS